LFLMRTDFSLLESSSVFLFPIVTDLKTPLVPLLAFESFNATKLWRLLVTPSLQCFHTNKALHLTTWQLPEQLSPILLEASADFRDFRNATSRLGTWILLGFFPFQRQILGTWRTGLPSWRSPFLGFLNLSTGSNALLNSQVYSTLQALLGFGLQSFTLRWSSYVFRTRAPSSLPAFHDFLPHLIDIPAYLHHGGLSVPAMHQTAAPLSPCGDRLSS